MCTWRRTRRCDAADARQVRCGRWEPIADARVRGGGGLRLHVREWGNRDGPSLVVHPWLVAEPAVLGSPGQWPARRAVSPGHLRQPRSRRCPRSRSTPAATWMPSCGRTTWPRSSSTLPWTPGARRLVVRRVHRDATTSAPTATARIAGINLVGAAVMLKRRASTTSAQASSSTRRRPACPTSRRTSPPSNDSCGPARQSRSASPSGARRCAGTWWFPRRYVER